MIKAETIFNLINAMTVAEKTRLFNMISVKSTPTKKTKQKNIPSVDLYTDMIIKSNNQKYRSVSNHNETQRATNLLLDGI